MQLSWMTRLIALCGAFAFSAIIAACGQPQAPAERGDAAGSTYEGEPSPTEGPLEGFGEQVDKAGEATGQAVERMGEEARDAARKATEPTTPTQPAPTEPKQP